MGESFVIVESAETGEYAAECRKAEKSALALIARAEQCSRGLKHKLEKKKYSPRAVESTLKNLSELDLVNDRRYAELWLKARIKKERNGPRMLNMSLKVRGIDRETAEAALTAVLTSEAETELLRRCIDKFVPGKEGKQNQKMAIRRFLKMQGFSTDIIDRYIEEEY